MLTFIFGIIGILVIIGLFSFLSDFQNNAIECILGILVLISIYAIISGAMSFMFWLGYIIGPPYAIVVTILLILSPFILLFLYNKLKSNGTTDLLNNKIKENKKIVSISIFFILVLVILLLVVPIITYNPLDNEPYNVECPEDYSISKDKIGYPTFDNEFSGYIRYSNLTGEINVWHHNAHGNNLKYFLNQMKKYDSINVDKTKKISVDGEPAYKIEGSWRYGKYGDEGFVIFVHNDEYYLIYFDDIPEKTQNAFLNSFKFK